MSNMRELYPVCGTLRRSVLCHWGELSIKSDFIFLYFFFYCCCKSIARCKLDLIWSFSSPFSNIFLRNKTGGIFGKHRHTIGIESSRRQIAVQHQLICFPVCELSRSRVMMIIFSKYGCLQPLMQRAKDIKVIVQVFWCGVVCGTYC